MSVAPPRPAGAITCALLALGVTAALLAPSARPARAQSGSPSEPVRQMMVVDSVVRATVRALQGGQLGNPLIVRDPSGSAFEPLSSRPVPPLDAVHRQRIQRAAMLRNQGQFEASRDSMSRMLSELPHHPLVLSEWCKSLLVLEQWAAVEKVAKAERAAQGDSVLLARALEEAEERLGKPTEAALTAVEAWTASPLMGNWANTVLRRPLPYDVPRVREAMRRATARDATRGDLAAALARLDWRANDMPAMLKSLRAASSGAGGPGSPRQTFAEELLQNGAARDTTAALEILIDLSSDHALQAGQRDDAARRAWTLFQSRGLAAEGASRIAAALADLPTAQWDAELSLEVARALRQSGRTREARALLDAVPEGTGSPAMALERALTDLRDGPPERALPALSRLAGESGTGAYYYAEALFFSGASDSAHTWYLRAGGDPGGEKTGAALERAFLIEDAAPREALPAFARAGYAAWRGDTHTQLAIADSLFRVLPRRSLWAQSAMLLSDARLADGDARGALEPLLALADSLPSDRLAPLARQRAGDLYRDALHEPTHAIEQYEACLTRYPGAWNAPAVRRSLEALRPDRRL